MKASRTGFTEALVNCAIGYTIDLDPADIIVLRPTEAACKKWSKSQFDAMVRNIPDLRPKVSIDRTRDRSNEILHKFFSGGELHIIPATSVAALSDIEGKFVFADEVDRYELSVGIEGDPLNLAYKRAATKWGYKLIDISSPTIDSISRIYTSWQQSDQQHYFVPCPHCKHPQVLIFGPQSMFNHLSRGFLKYDKDNLSWWCYECTNCHKNIGEESKQWMVENGTWVAQRPNVTEHAGFQISELYSLLSVRGWKGIIQEHLEAGNDPHLLQVWINTSLGEVFRRDTYRVNPDIFLDRREDYMDIPADVLLLTAGVDKQDDRFEVVVRGWGLRDESWFIERFVVHGRTDEPETKAKLDEYLAKEFQHASGLKMKIAAAGMDTQGGDARHMYEYIRDALKVGKRYYALKGIGGFNKNILYKDSRDKKVGARLIIVGVDSAKDLIFKRLKLVRNEDGTFPRGFMHYNRIADRDYFEQLGSEHIMIKHVRGFPIQTFEKDKNKRNEALDCEVYALTALLTLNPNFDKVKENLDQRILQLKDANASELPPSVESAKPMQRKHRRGNWATNWR